MVMFFGLLVVLLPSKILALGTRGSVFDPGFLSSIAPFYSQDTGTELMGPLLYSLVRSTRPKCCVELGAGYTTPWLLQALSDGVDDNIAERKDPPWTHWVSTQAEGVLTDAQNAGTYTGTGQLSRLAHAPYSPKLHCVDTFDPVSSHYSKLDLFTNALRTIDATEKLWSLHRTEWSAFRQAWDKEQSIDFLWLDGFNPDTFDDYWPLVSEDGGCAVLHSTLNNHRNYSFLQQLKLKQATSSFCDFELLSLCEPHKWQQNSFTLLRKVSKYRAEEHLVRGRA